MAVGLTADGCRVEVGRWVDVYTGEVFTDPSSLDVDHIVPLAEAHRSGGAGWPAGRRAAFANDLELPDALIAVSASANRSKGDRGPDRWLPPHPRARCRYVRSWIEVKHRWSLTVTSTEKQRLLEVLAGCPCRRAQAAARC